MKTTVVVPLFDEAENVQPLCAELREVADADPRIAEVILVDDGSHDATLEQCKAFCRQDSRFLVISLRRNFGQTAALSAGFDAATSEVIVPMDGDLQMDAHDIPRLLDKVEEGYDVVSGWRRFRKDSLLTRRIPSWLANKLISRITGVRLHDHGCTLKAYKRDLLKDVRLYGEMHRFIPCLANWRGITLAEIPVNHRARAAGRSKYSLSRIVRVLLDLINVKFLVSYSTSPIQVFGKAGLLSFLAAFVSLGVTIWMKVARRYDMTGNPLLILSVLLVMIGVQLIAIGLLGEIQIRTYYETQRKPTYAIREIFPVAGGKENAEGGRREA
jgi:glycosyltransferase involved in cell wall biosynthesis